jgi:hypothetical protein
VNIPHPASALRGRQRRGVAADREILAGDLRLSMSNRGHKDTDVRADDSPQRPCKAMGFRTGTHRLLLEAAVLAPMGLICLLPAHSSAALF